MSEEYVGVLIKPKKYIELLENNMYYIRPPKQEKKIEYGATIIQTIYNLPFEITNDIDEDIKLVTKEEYSNYKNRSIEKYADFMKNYEPDCIWGKIGDNDD